MKQKVVLCLWRPSCHECHIIQENNVLNCDMNSFSPTISGTERDLKRETDGRNVEVVHVP